MNKRLAVTAVILLVSAFFIEGCNTAQEEKEKVKLDAQNIEAIARKACEGVGVVSRASEGSIGSPIVILEENHTSVAGQIQHAITLVRLYNNYGMRNIALEGYLKEHKKISTGWFNEASKGDLAVKAQLAARLLKEGEISSAEFVKLVYDDINLHPIEIKSEYSVELDDDASRAPAVYLLKTAELALTQEDVPTLQRLQSEIETLDDEVEKQEKYKELYEHIISADSWVKAKFDIMQDQNRMMTAEEMLSFVQEINDRAIKKQVQFDPQEQEAMLRNIAFWDGRSKASDTMVRYTSDIAAQGRAPVPMIIGAAHTERICNLLTSANRSYAVVTPLALKNQNSAGNLSIEMFYRKYKRLSVYSEGISGTLLEVFPPSKIKKPEPVIPEPWLQAKAEIYLFTDRIARSLLDPPGPPGGNEPPYGFKDSDFSGNWVQIDPGKIQIISDTEDSQKKTVLFPIIINPNDRKKRKEIWAKAGGVSLPTPPILTTDERKMVESLLEKALSEVQEQSGEESKTKVEDEAGRVQITLKTIATFASSKDTATRTALHQI